MTNKHTKKALLSSALALILCFAMLAGTTLAWFTDSVTSGVNTIESGNLDVVLEYKNAVDGTWTEVTETTKLFKDGALYEPGYTEVVFLRVRNAGTLALKYDLNLNVLDETKSTNVNGAEFSLKDYLEVGYYSMDESMGQYLLSHMFGTREAALSNVTTTKLSADQGIIRTAAPMEAGDNTALLVAVVLTMPETVGNEANHKTGAPAPTIDMGISLVATQFTSESDSFNNQYDANAWAEITQNSLTPENYATTTLESNTNYTLVGDFGGKNVSLVMAKGVENVVFDGSMATNINELIVTQNGQLIDNATTAVGARSGKVTIKNFNVLSQINVFACKTEVEVAHNTAEALMVYAGNCDVKVHNNNIDANFEAHRTYRDENNTWNNNNYGIALNIFDYNLWLDNNTVTDAVGHAIGINGWEGTIDNGEANVIESFKNNNITVNSTQSKRAAFKVWDDETYASNDADTNVVNSTTQAFIDAVLEDGSNTFNITPGYDHTIFSIYNVNTNQ